MSYRIMVYYMIPDGHEDRYEITGPGPLMYRDPLAAPVMVQTIMREGLTMGRMLDDGTVTRRGNYVPPHRITWIEWSDDYEELA